MTTARITVGGADLIKKEWKLRPSQIERASRLTVNQITRELEKELGTTIPKHHGTSIAGFKRVRAYKKLAKAGRRKRLSGITWIGINAIAATYAGKPRNIKGGAKAGRYFFKDAFVVKMKSGHVGVFKRIKGSNKIQEQTVELTDAKAKVVRALEGKRSKIRQIMQKQLHKQVKKK